MLQNTMGHLVTCNSGHCAWMQTLSDSPTVARFRCAICGHEISVPNGYVAPAPLPSEWNNLLKTIADQEAQLKTLTGHCADLALEKEALETSILRALEVYDSEIDPAIAENKMATILMSTGVEVNRA